MTDKTIYVLDEPAAEKVRAFVEREGGTLRSMPRKVCEMQAFVVTLPEQATEQHVKAARDQFAHDPFRIGGIAR